MPSPLRLAPLGLVLALLGAALAAAPAARAQASGPGGAAPRDTTAEANAVPRRAMLQAARDAKTASDLSEEPPGSLESFFLWVEDMKLPQRLTGAAQAPIQILPGGIGPNTGLGGRLAYVPFYRRTDLDLFLAGGASVRGYWVAEATLGYRYGRAFTYTYARARRRVERFAVTSQNRDLLAPSDRPVDPFDFDLRDATTGTLLGVRPHPTLALAGGLAYAAFDPGDDNGPTTDDAMPPFTTTTHYLGLSGHLILDTRDSRYRRGFGERYTPNTDELTERPLSPHTGSLLSVEFFRFLERSDATGDFAQLRIEAQQYVSFRNKYHTLALRHRTTFTDPDDAARVPFYQLPYVGGDFTVRGYQNFAFRDLHAMVTNIEYRWQVWLLMDLVAFADVGKTFDRARQWGFTDLRTSYGGGVRLASKRTTLLRVEIARSPRQTRLVLAFSSAF